MKRPARSARGFTLLEMLAAAAVLSILVLLVGRIIGDTSATAGRSTRNLDADTEARLVLDRIGADLAAMVRREDVDYLFEKKGGNDRMFFYAEAEAFADPSIGAGDLDTVALIGYRVDEGNRLERLAKGLPWSGAGGVRAMTFKTGADPAGNLDVAWASSVAEGSSDGDWSPIAEGVFRFEIQFLRDQDGAPVASSGSARSLAGYSGVAVTLAVLDSASREIASGMEAVAGALADAGADPVGGVWRGAIEGETVAGASGLPRAAASQVRIYQRTYPLSGR